MRRTKNVLTAPCVKPLASTATRARPRQRRRQPCIRRTVSPTAPVDGLAFEALEKTVLRREVGHTRQSQRVTQFVVLAQAHLGFAKSPVLVAHQTEDGQQLRLSELVLAEACSIGGSTARPTSQAVRANGKSPTSAIALAASEQTDPDAVDRGWRTQILLGGSKDVNRASLCHAKTIFLRGHLETGGDRALIAQREDRPKRTQSKPNNR